MTEQDATTPEPTDAALVPPDQPPAVPVTGAGSGGWRRAFTRTRVIAGGALAAALLVGGFAGYAVGHGHDGRRGEMMRVGFDHRGGFQDRDGNGYGPPRGGIPGYGGPGPVVPPGLPVDPNATTS